MKLRMIYLIVSVLALFTIFPIKTSALVTPQLPPCYTYCFTYWKVVGKTFITCPIKDGILCIDYHSKNVCMSYRNATRYPGAASCELANSNGSSVTVTVTATVSGSNMVGSPSLSTAVGYSVDKSTTLTGGYSMSTAPFTSGGIWVQAVYNHRYKVTQQEVWCQVISHAGTACYAQPIFKDAITEQYSNPYFTTWQSVI